MEIKVGQVYRDPYDEDVIRISRIAGVTVYFEILETRSHWGTDQQDHWIDYGTLQDLYILDEASTVKQILNKYL
jgi:hypothetical protein